MKTKFGKVKQGSHSKAIAKGQKEPWVLASSLPKDSFNPERIISLYSLRMQIEQSFRDLKNRRYGYEFKNTLTRSTKRLNILLLLVAIVNFVVWGVGVLAEQKMWHRECQSNTSKKRTLSLFYLGFIVLKSKRYTISMPEIGLAIKNLLLCTENVLEGQL